MMTLGPPRRRLPPHRPRRPRRRRPRPGPGRHRAARRPPRTPRPSSYAGHPIVGVWMVESPIGRAIAVYSAEGSVIAALAATQAGPAGVTYSSTQIGTWEPTSERGTHLTVVQLLSDGAGAYAGSVTVDAFQEVSEDGQTWMSGAGIDHNDPRRGGQRRSGDRRPAARGRDPDGRRNPGFPEGTPTAATPAA